MKGGIHTEHVGHPQRDAGSHEPREAFGRERDFIVASRQTRSVVFARLSRREFKCLTGVHLANHDLSLSDGSAARIRNGAIDGSPIRLAP